MARRPAVAVVLSFLGHALVLHGLATPAPAAPGAAPRARTLGAAALSAGAAAARRAAVRWARARLVAEARAELAAGRLALGRFLLHGDRLDAEARGQPFDLAEAEARYDARVRALREALAEGELRGAAPAVFGDLRYYGQPGGRMGDALLEGGGSCEQIAQLVAAAAYDAGAQRAVALRFYGGAMSDGASHVAAVALDGREEHDLLSGRPAIRTGARFPAADLVEAYARTHGLAPALAAPPAPGGDPARPPGDAARPEPRPTLAAGFPPNRDVYPGALPLYAKRAVQAPDGGEDGAGAPAEAEDHARNCAYFLRMAILHPPALEIDVGPSAAPRPGRFGVEPRRVPNPERLEREAGLLHAVEALERSDRADPADRLMAWACVSALGETAAVDFALAGEHRLARMAAERERRARDAGRDAIAAIRWPSAEGEAVRKRLLEEYAGRTWLLLKLDGGDDVVFELVRRAGKEDWGRVSALAALVVAPETRPRALALLQGLTREEQIDVMHEVFHAHDHMRPWASSFDLEPAGEGAPGAELLRVYRVFRGLAWRLWEGQRAPEETLAALAAESRRAALDPAWEATLLEYYGRNALGLYSQRASGLELVRRLQAAVKENGHPSLAALGRRLAYIEEQARLDATTLADAWRLK